MIVKPKVRGFVCVTAHPTGCAAHVQEQIDYVKAQGPIAGGPKKVLVLGASTGYGLSSRIVSAFGCGAGTLGVFFERPAEKGRPASAGWYNSAAVDNAARAAGLYSNSINGDAFSDALKTQVVDTLKRELGPVDLVIYSLASPRRTDPKTGEVYKSVLKPIGQSYTSKTVDTDKKTIEAVSLDPATPEDIAATQKVMGGEDWELWMRALADAGLLAKGAKTVAYSYIGPELTYPIYRNGTIGKAKEHLEHTAKALDALLAPLGGKAFVSVNKAVVTQASSAIPVVPLYISLLLRVMREKNVDEGCIEQIHRLYKSFLYTGGAVPVDAAGRIRIDDLEMRPEIQQGVAALWPQVTTENLENISDFGRYQTEFLKLFGFGLKGVNYDAEVDVEVPLP